MCTWRASYSQIPQMSSSRQLNLEEAFSVGAPVDGGKKRALLIGINYIGQQGELRGCHNDVDSMLKYLQTSGFADDTCEVCTWPCLITACLLPLSFRFSIPANAQSLYSMLSRIRR